MAGFENDVMYAANADFSQSDNQSPSSANGLSTNGQMWIGSTALNAGSTHINVGSITSPDSSVTIGFSSPNITLVVAGGTSVGKTITGNTGGAISPTSGNWNIFGTGSITTDGSGSTLTAQLTGLTNHAVLVGAGSATITKIAATANTGAVLQNNSGADPSYSTATYPSTTTVSQLLYSSATNTVSGLATANRAVVTTNATGVPVVTALATDGQLIIGSTAGAPAAATLTAGTGISITNASNSITITNSGAIAPSTNLTLYEEFLGWTAYTNASNPGGGPIGGGTYTWNILGAGAVAGWQGVTAASSGNPGIIQNLASATFDNLVLINNSAGNNPQIILGGGSLTINWIIKIATLSAANPRYTLRIGLGDTYNATTDQANGVYFEYSDNVNSGNYTIKTANASSRTTANTSTAATTNFVNLGITVNAAATSVSYFVNGTQVANSPISTNIPTAAISPFLQIAASVGTVAAASILVDAMYLTQTFTTPR